jgi:hypothetical protein
VLLLLPDNRTSRSFLRDAAVELQPTFTQAGVRALELLRAGIDPGGSAVILVPRSQPASRPTGQRNGQRR